ncbi:hypothetical protein BRAS3843_110003 [Bradyrhizobium sp. STM 3843]|nr:hypothetical protein BRAS3843_110003 [Bradyrhizobium sp. STM 3843]
MMSHVPDLIVLAWLAGILAIAHRARVLLYSALRHPAPDARPNDFFRFGIIKLAVHVDPAKLTEAGRRLLSRAQWGERFLLLWTMDVPLFVLLPLLLPPPHP